MPACSKLPDNAVLETWKTILNQKGSTAAIYADNGEIVRTFQEIETEAAYWSQRLGRIPAGAVIALQLGNRAEWPALLLACFRHGLIPLPLGRHIEASERALALETCGASVLVDLAQEELCVTPLPYKTREFPAPAPHFLKLTSGTTSAPRAILFRAEHLLADCVHICETMGIREDDLNYGVIPLSHSYGFSNLVTPLLCRGVSLVISEDRMPRAILDGLAHTGATVFPGMPVFFDKFAALENTPALPKLRLCISAGAPLPKAVAEKFSAKFGLKIHTFYGSSECGGIGYDQAETPTYEDGFAGTPMSGVDIKPQEDGSIRIQSPAVGLGYWPQGNPPDPALVGGKFVPSDMVSFTPEGMTITGRVSEVINVAGRKLNPLEVEAQLQRFPGVQQIVVFGVPSALRHEEAVACVAGQVDGQELLQFARTALSGWQVPKDVWLVPEIPANERGKISRRELAKRYLEAIKRM